MKLTSNAVTELFLACCFKSGEMYENAIEEEGVTIRIGFKKASLEEHKSKILELLDQVPGEFRTTGGGGWTLMNFCFDVQEMKWGELLEAQELMLLGMAIGRVVYLNARADWPVQPMGLPYIAYIHDKEMPMPKTSSNFINLKGIQDETEPVVSN